MSPTETDRAEAVRLWQQAHQAQARGQITLAIRLYRQSLRAYPTAEAHTFLGWTYSQIGRTEEAIEQCKLAIEIDPDFGNPYNDIGAYLIELDRWEEAIPWLQKAVEAPRYESRAFPHLNLGRVCERAGDSTRALESYRKALEEDPTYWPARQALRLVIGRLN